MPTAFSEFPAIDMTTGFRKIIIRRAEVWARRRGHEYHERGQTEYPVLIFSLEMDDEQIGIGLS